MKVLGEPKRRRCAEMSMLMYAFFQQYHTVKHSAGNGADQPPSNNCLERRRERHRERETETERQRQRQRERETETKRETDRDRDRQRQTETDR